MNGRTNPSERIVPDEMAELHAKLDRLDEAIRGNGKPGINVRLDRLEQVVAAWRRLTWIVIGAFASAGASVLLQLGQIVFGA